MLTSHHVHDLRIFLPYSRAMWSCARYSSTCRYFNLFGSVSHRLHNSAYIFDGSVWREHNNFSFGTRTFYYRDRVRARVFTRAIRGRTRSNGVNRILTALPLKIWPTQREKYEIYVEREGERVREENEKGSRELGCCRCFFFLCRSNLVKFIKWRVFAFGKLDMYKFSFHIANQNNDMGLRKKKWNGKKRWKNEEKKT